MTALWDLKRKPRLLFVEDDLDLGKMFKIYFENLSEVTLTTRGAEGLALYSSLLFDLVILDLGVHGLDEYEFMRSIRRSGNNVPVLFLTQKNWPSRKLHGLEIDADDYLSKPFDIEEVKTRIKRGLRYRMRYLK